MIDDLGRTDNRPRRIALFGVFLLIVAGVLIGRLWQIQILKSESYAMMAEGNRVRTMAVDAPRGRIFDRYGRLVVGNRLTLAVYVMPAECDDRPSLIKNLADVFGTAESEIEQKLANRRFSEYFPKIIDEDADIAIVTKIKERPADFPGVAIVPRPNRDYPYAQTAAHILGYVGQVTEDELEGIKYHDRTAQDIVGKSGVEYQYDRYLQGEKGIEYLEVNAKGVPLRTLHRQEPRPGADIYLSIDLTIQQEAERALATAIDKARHSEHKHAEAGAVVVLDTATSEVLAMASYPFFDPSVFVGGISGPDWQSLNDPANGNPLLARAYASAYPPGSAFKPIVGLAALTESVVTPQTRFSCSGAWFGFGSAWSKVCWKKTGHGQVDFTQAIVQSCDIAFYNIGLLLYRQPGEKMQVWARNLGLGSATGIDLPFESPGCIPDRAWKKSFYSSAPERAAWVPGDTVNMAIGQGDVLVTPLQLANAYAVFANGGALHRPHVLKKINATEQSPGLIAKSEPVAKAHAPAQSLQTVRSALAKVTTEGTAHGSFWDFPISVAGKTGTAQVGAKDDQAWFVGYAPVDQPKYVVLATVEQGGHGSTTAAPIVKQVMAKLFDIDLSRDTVSEEDDAPGGGGD